MGTTQLSRTLRVRNEIAESVGRLNELCRTESVPAIVKSLEILIQAIERGETFVDRLTQERLNQLEDLVGSLGNGRTIAPAAVEELTITQLCKRFKIENASYQAQWHHKTVEEWLQQETGWRYIGGDRFTSIGWTQSGQAFKPLLTCRNKKEACAEPLPRVGLLIILTCCFYK